MHPDRFSTLRHVYADGVVYPLDRASTAPPRRHTETLPYCPPSPTAHLPPLPTFPHCPPSPTAHLPPLLSFAHCPPSPIAVASLTCALPLLAGRRPFDQRTGMIFVGNLNNPTNLHGMVWFMREVGPASALPSPAQPTTTTQPHYHPPPLLSPTITHHHYSAPLSPASHPPPGVAPRPRRRAAHEFTCRRVPRGRERPRLWACRDAQVQYPQTQTLSLTLSQTLTSPLGLSRCSGPVWV